jgi:hypothetical protein
MTSMRSRSWGTHEQSSRSWGTHEHTEPAPASILDGIASNTYHSSTSQLVCLKDVCCSFALLLLCVLLALLDQRTSRPQARQTCSGVTYQPGLMRQGHTALSAQRPSRPTAAHPHTPSSRAYLSAASLGATPSLSSLRTCAAPRTLA